MVFGLIFFSFQLNVDLGLSHVNKPPHEQVVVAIYLPCYFGHLLNDLKRLGELLASLENMRLGGEDADELFVEAHPIEDFSGEDLSALDVLGRLLVVALFAVLLRKDCHYVRGVITLDAIAGEEGRG